MAILLHYDYGYSYKQKNSSPEKGREFSRGTTLIGHCPLKPGNGGYRLTWYGDHSTSALPGGVHCPQLPVFS